MRKLPPPHDCWNPGCIAAQLAGQSCALCRGCQVIRDGLRFNAEFGERCLPIGGRNPGVLTVAGPELTIEVGGAVYPFEWHSYGGPIPLNKRGDPKDLGPKHRFWTAVSHWAEQGKRLDENRRALWHEPPAEDFSAHVRVGRNLYPKEMAERLAGRANR